MKRQHLPLLLGAFFFVADQATKWLAIVHNKATEIGFITIQAVQNSGAIFSLATPRGFIVLVGMGGIVALSLLYRSRSNFSQKIGLMLVLSGGASNLIDRLWRDSVIDTLSIGTFIFNGADILIFVGLITLGINHLWPKSSVKS